MLLLAMILAVVYWPRREPLELTPAAERDREARGASSGEGADAEYVIVGGVRRKRTDVDSKSSLGADTSVDPSGDYGKTPPVSANANDDVESISRAIREGRQPERVSPVIVPAPFDAEAFESDPEAYLNSVSPGRVFQSAQPGPDVPRMMRDSPYYQQLVQGESVPLTVIAVPRAPVTFTSFDLGRFENKLTSITVRADEQGRATVMFEATPGTIEDANILAASPLSSGQVKFIVNVQLKRSD